MFDVSMSPGIVDNIILVTDSYKVSQHLQFPPDTTHVYSYFESRGGKFDRTVFFGLQYIIKRWLCGPIVTEEKIAEAKKIYKLHFGTEIFNENGWRYILEEHKGYLPIRIKSVPEGTIVPVKNVLFTVENTDPKCFWLTNHLETLLVQSWYPTTVATTSYFQKLLIAKYLKETANDFSNLPFMLHDFGFRAATCVEGAGIGDTAHLVNFQGTDTIVGLVIAQKYYHCEMAGFSIPASEHSTITTWGKESEVDAFRNMLEKFPTGLVSCVSDSYDIWNACEKYWGEDLRDLVIKRGETNGRLVVRPDSGKPAEVVVKVLEILGSKFGTEVNSKGFKLLPPYVRVIQGDGINYESLGEILENMKKHGWSADNLVFGSGGALLQKLNRDTQKCAFKCSCITRNGKEVDVSKDPVTDPGKKSKKGRLTLEVQNGEFTTIQEGNGNPDNDVLVTVYENGILKKDFTLDEIRKRAWNDDSC